jgi:hypothetical protein
MIKSTKPRIKLPFVATISGSEIDVNSDGEFTSTHKMLVVNGVIKNGKIKFNIKCNFEINETVETVQRLLKEINNGKTDSEN